MSQLTTHVLDLSAGRPAENVPLLLEVQASAGAWKQVGRGTTDKDGRSRDLLPPDGLIEGTYRLTFDTQAYFASNQVNVGDASQHYHIPLLLSPFGYSTYRGN